jgi:multidrug efflux pump subunit AcrA (membrane-fusion protein)
MAVAAGIVVVAAGGGTAAAAAATDAPPRWQLATVRLASVTQTVESSGTISAAHKATPSFSTSGTVKFVDVKVGQTVSTGQRLAQLDTTSLQASVDSANSTLASANQRLATDETGQTDSADGATGGGNTSATTAAYGDSAPADATPAVDTLTSSSQSATAATAYASSVPISLDDLVKQVESAQTEVLAAQQRVDAGQNAVDAAQQPVDDDVKQNVKLRDAQQSDCAAPDDSDSSTASTASADCTSAMANYEASATRLASDMTTLDDKISAQDGYVTTLDTAITALDKLVAQLQSAASASGSGSGSGSTGSSTATGSTGAQGSTGSKSSTPSNSGSGAKTGHSTERATSTPASAAQLAADQAAIDAANAQVTVATQNLAAATLISPMAGTVAAIGVSAGASSDGGTITIVGTGAQKVSATVPLADVDLVKRGQSVDVAADGVRTTLHGTVTSVGMLSTTSGSTTTFLVTITLDRTQANLYDGTGADVVITTGSARNAITVANSAIHAGARGSHTVTVLKDGKTTTVSVTLGVAGTDVTQVKSGLQTGQQVVLADLSEVLPTSTTTSPVGNFPSLGGAGGFGPGGR